MAIISLCLFSHSVVFNFLWHYGLQHTRLPCPSPSPGACPNAWPSSQWCHPTTLSSSIPFPHGLQTFPASGFFPMSQLIPSGGQSIGASASSSVPAMNIQGWFPLGLTGLTSLLPKGLSRVFPAPQFERINSSALSLLYGPNSHIRTILLDRPQLWLYGHLPAKWCLCFLIHCLGLS